MVAFQDSRSRFAELADIQRDGDVAFEFEGDVALRLRSDGKCNELIFPDFKIIALF